MDSGSIQTALSVGVPSLAVLVGILVNNSRLSDLRAHMDARFANMDDRFDDTKATLRADIQVVRAELSGQIGELRAELRRVEEVMDLRLKRVEERVS